MFTDESRRHSESIDIDALLEFSQLLNESDDPGFIFNALLLSVMGKLGLGRAAIALPEGDGVYRVRHAKGSATALLDVSFRWKGDVSFDTLSIDSVEAIDQSRLRDGKITDLVPLCFGERTFAIILIGATFAGRSLDRSEIDFLILVGAIAAMALEGGRVRLSLYDVNRRLERRVHRLRSLFEAAKGFTALLDEGGILRLLGYTLMGEMTVARFAVALHDGTGYSLVVNRFPHPIPPTTLARMVDEGTTLLPDAASDPLGGELFELGVRASIPMEAQGTVRGLLLVGQRLQHPIEEEDAEYLASLANIAMSSLENARYLAEMIEKKRLEEDLRIASQIQQGLLPKTLPELAGYQIAARTVPTQQVGGDCYDVIDLGAGRVLLSIADVSGKGTPASLLMANVQAALRTLARLDLGLAELTERINDVIYENTGYDKFITAFFGIVDATSGTVSYVNAGHNPPYLFSNGTVAQLDQGGLILGVMPTAIPYEVGVVSMESGDLLVMYTDGVNEALDVDRQEYGEERLKGLFLERPCSSAEDALERLREDVATFTEGAPQSDDITIVALRRM